MNKLKEEFMKEYGDETRPELCLTSWIRTSDIWAWINENYISKEELKKIIKNSAVDLPDCKIIYLAELLVKLKKYEIYSNN